MKYLPLASAFGLCALACASAAYWGLPWFQPAPAPAAAKARPGPAPPGIEAAAALFGGAPGAAPATAFRLKGVIEDGAESVAIIAEEGKPALAVGVGREVAPVVIVQEVHQRYVLLAQGGTVRRLDLPDSPVAGLELVAGVPAVPARAPVVVARSGGAMPLPIVNPEIANTPGKTPEQIQQMQQAEQMRQVQRIQDMQRAHRPPPPGIGPAAFGAKPVT